MSTVTVLDTQQVQDLKRRILDVVGNGQEFRARQEAFQLDEHRTALYDELKAVDFLAGSRARSHQRFLATHESRVTSHLSRCGRAGRRASRCSATNTNATRSTSRLRTSRSTLTATASHTSWTMPVAAPAAVDVEADPPTSSDSRISTSQSAEADSVPAVKTCSRCS